MTEPREHLAHPSERWPELDTKQRWIIGLTVLLIAAIGVAHLPPGICFDDAGDLQTASATMGIAHSPGYMGYITVGWLLSRILFFVDPAYVVSVACLACMVVGIGLTIVLLVRLGLHALPACVLGFLLVAHRFVWEDMVFPEVYAPSFGLLVAGSYLFLKYGRLHRPRDLYLAGAVFGFLIINRPPAVFFVPALVAGWLVIERRHGVAWRAALRRALVGMACGALPAMVVLVIMGVRDTPDNPYHVIERHRDIFGGLPVYDSSLTTRLARLRWIITGRQFDYLKGANYLQVLGKLRWIRRQFYVYETPPFICLLAILGVGVWVLARRGGEWALLAAGVVIGNVAFLCIYRVHGQAANLLPTLFAGALIIGALIARSFPERLTRPRLVTVSILFACACAWTVYHSSVRPNYAIGADATPFLAAVDAKNLPPNAVIVTWFSEACPLWYATLVMYHRSDVRIVPGLMRMWQNLALAYLDRPVFYTTDRGLTPPGWTLSPWGNLSRLVRAPVDQLDGR